MADRWQISVDPSLCKKSGICVGSAPAHFRFGTDGAEPVSTEVDAHDDVLDAAALCPTEAILLRHTGTGELIDPAG